MGGTEPPFDSVADGCQEHRPGECPTSDNRPLCDADGCARPAVLAVTVTHADGRTGGAHWCAEHNPWDALIEEPDDD